MINRSMKLIILAIALAGVHGVGHAAENPPQPFVTPTSSTAGSEQGNAGKVYVAGMLGGAGWSRTLDVTIGFYPLDQYTPGDLNYTPGDLNVQRAASDPGPGFIFEGGRVRAKWEKEMLEAVKPAM